MGKIFKAPKMPSLPPVAASPTATTSTNDTDTSDEPTPDEQRVVNILSRSRSRLGTIATSFNGVLNNNDGTNALTPTRKTLLGE